jgi:hypothetical protein
MGRKDSFGWLATVLKLNRLMKGGYYEQKD